MCFATSRITIAAKLAAQMYTMFVREAAVVSLSVLSVSRMVAVGAESVGAGVVGSIDPVECDVVVLDVGTSDEFCEAGTPATCAAEGVSDIGFSCTVGAMD